MTRVGYETIGCADATRYLNLGEGRAVVSIRGRVVHTPCALLDDSYYRLGPGAQLPYEALAFEYLQADPATRRCIDANGTVVSFRAETAETPGGMVHERPLVYPLTIMGDDFRDCARELDRARIGLKRDLRSARETIEELVRSNKAARDEAAAWRTTTTELDAEIARLRAELTNALPAQVDARLQAAQRAHNAELRVAEASKLGVQTQLNAALAHKRNWKLAAKRALKRNGELHAELNRLRAESTPQVLDADRAWEYLADASKTLIDKEGDTVRRVGDAWEFWSVAGDRWRGGDDTSFTRDLFTYYAPFTVPAEPAVKPRPTANQLCAELRTWVEDATVAELDELRPVAQGLNSHWLNEVAALRRQLELTQETRQRYSDTICSVANALGCRANATAMLRAISDLKEAPDLPSCAREIVSARNADGDREPNAMELILQRLYDLWYGRLDVVAQRRNAILVGAAALRIAEEAS